MATEKPINFVFTLTTLTVLLILSLSIIPSRAQLSPTFYARTCPNVLRTIRGSIWRAVARERRMAASLIRLHFHDCFVQGCDGSVLLDDGPTIQSEKSAVPNLNSARGFDVIEAAKRDVERTCPGVVSCADILAVAARDASVAVGGPSWNVKLGRRDSTTANRDAANRELPSPFSSLQGLITSFSDKGLSERDMVALSGSHTIGQAQCFLFRSRIYSNGTDVDPLFARLRSRTCPQTGGDSNLSPLDFVTPNRLDNNYFTNLRQRRGLLQSDQVLFSGGSTDSLVFNYSRNPHLFASDFANAMLKMSEIQPLLGSNGIIRRVCSATN
ncbi:Peroxidase 5 [Striga hermonthica]|uniref:Peroxidase n=1 Tax=Striga hermonthica TaxID=68872 RepID=A0A9N7RQ42_STRHE|nr:Peroxidase 5 [Striga hermonthica]